MASCVKERRSARKCERGLPLPFSIERDAPERARSPKTVSVDRDSLCATIPPKCLVSKIIGNDAVLRYKIAMLLAMEI